MLIPEDAARIWLYGQPTDMRKSFGGLSALVRTKLAEDPANDQLFVFINRLATQMKVLYFERCGYCVWAKRLEQGRFHPEADRYEVIDRKVTRRLAQRPGSYVVLEYRLPVLRPKGSATVMEVPALRVREQSLPAPRREFFNVTRRMLIRA